MPYAPTSEIIYSDFVAGKGTKPVAVGVTSRISQDNLKMFNKDAKKNPSEQFLLRG